MHARGAGCVQLRHFHGMVLVFWFFWFRVGLSLQDFGLLFVGWFIYFLHWEPARRWLTLASRGARALLIRMHTFGKNYGRTRARRTALERIWCSTLLQCQLSTIFPTSSSVFLDFWLPLLPLFSTSSTSDSQDSKFLLLLQDCSKLPNLLRQLPITLPADHLPLGNLLGILDNIFSMLPPLLEHSYLTIVDDIQFVWKVILHYQNFKWHTNFDLERVQNEHLHIHIGIFEDLTAFYRVEIEMR